MGQCFSAKSAESQAPGGIGAMGPPRMGPDAVENQLFQSEEGAGPLFPSRVTPEKLATQRSQVGQSEALPDGSITDERVEPPQLANGRTPSKKTVMRRSLPPVGVKIVLDEDFRRIQAEDQRMAFENAITHDFAETLGTAPERFRIMRIEAGSVVMFINVIASLDDEDARSPMQLAAELVMMAKRENSALRQRKTLRNVREADIVEEPFAFTRQDTRAGGVATMGSGNMAEQAQAFFAQTGASPAPMPTGRAAAQARVAAPLASPPRPAAVASPPMPAAVLKAKNTAELPGGTIPIEGGTYAGELDEGRRNGRGRQAAPSCPLLPCAS
jgi:hypothetical protein